jgi:DNA-binding NarL/FixJ family response regulator
VRVLIADDHPSTRAGVRESLERADFTVIGEADDAAKAVSLAIEHEPDICLLDVHMPGSGITAAQQITAQLPRTAVVMLTISNEDEDLFGAIRAGASGYLLKDMDPDRLALALKGIVSGEAAVPRSLVARLVEEFRGSGKRRLSLPDDRTVEFTEREWEVLVRLRDGLSTADMADQLFLSPVTVRRHLSSAFKKMRVSDRQAALEVLNSSRT